MAGYYVPFWVGTPFYLQLAVLHIIAGLIHLGMAILPVIGLFLARKYFVYDPKSNDAICG